VNSQRSVLVAEDDDNDVFLLRHAFQEAAVENPLYTVEDGQLAIDYLSGTGKYADRLQFPLPYLLILDLKMPRKTGLDVLIWLREVPVLRCLPVMVFSSSAHPADVEAAYDGGANAFVVKPAGTQKRVELVKTLRDFWLTFNEPPAAAGNAQRL
jgi:CheY-like chemotaxis protein